MGQLLFSVNYRSNAGDFKRSRSRVNEVDLYKKKGGRGGTKILYQYIEVKARRLC